MTKGLFKDIWHALRGLSRSPAFTLTAVLTLALGIGVNAHVFSAVNTYFIDFLPYPDADELSMLHTSTSRFDRGSISYEDFCDWREQNEVFEDLAAYRWMGLNLTGGDRPQRITALAGTARLFETLGANAAIGRTWLPEEDSPDAERVVVLSHRLWKDNFGADPEIVGRDIALDARSHTVIGVMPEDFWFPRNEEDLWVPARLERSAESRGSRWLRCLGRRKDGVSMDQAQAAMRTIAARIAEENPNTNGGVQCAVAPLYEDIVDPEMELSILCLWGAVIFVLLIACANVANLMLTRATGRLREFAIRSAIGASPWRIGRLLLTESLVLSLLGGVLGFILCLWGIDLTLASVPGDISIMQALVVDQTILFFTIGLSLVTAMIFGLAPVFQVTRTDLVDVIKNGEGRSGTGPGRQRLRSALAICQVALALILLAGAGVMAKSLVGLLSTDPGFDVERNAVARVSLPREVYAEDHQAVSFFRELKQRLAALPGVEAAGLVSRLPMGGSNSSTTFEIEGKPTAHLPIYEQPIADYQLISDGYFAAMGIPVLSGRVFEEGDREESQKVALISAETVRRFWPDSDPVGQRLRFDAESEIWYTIVGVVDDVYQYGVDSDLSPAIYRVMSQHSPRSLTAVMRTPGDPNLLLQPFKAAVAAIDPQLPVYGLESYRRTFERRMWGRQLTAELMGIYAIVALFLALVGVYGVISYNVSHRTREIGVRMALGATPGDVVRLVMRQSVWLAVIGLVIGTLGAVGMNRALESLLHEVSPTDPATFAVVIILLFATTLAASYLPAKRAALLHPMEALRYE